MMDPASELPLSSLTKFIRQHTHDVCNDLNGLDLEAALLSELVPAGDAAESVARIRGQIRRVAADLRELTAKFIEPQPVPALHAVQELFRMCQDQLSALEPAPTVQWSDLSGTAQVKVDAFAVADVFRELLANARDFGTGGLLLAAVRCEDGWIVLELREPKNARVEFAHWGRAPFAQMRRGHHGLGLWEAQRNIAANGGDVRRHFAPDAMELTTALRFPAA